MAGATAVSAAWREGLQTLPRALRQALTPRPFLVALFVAAALGALTTWLLGGLLHAPESQPSPALAKVAGSILVNLGALAAALALLPPGPGKGWRHLQAWLRAALLGVAATLGWALAPGEGGLRMALMLALLSAAQAAALCGIAALLGWWTGRFERAGRALLLAALALGATSLLWSRDFIIAAYRYDAPAATAGAQAVMHLNPPAVLATAWNDHPGRLDLLRQGESYRLWLGNDLACWTYPRLTPARIPAGGDDPNATVFQPGVVLALAVWGLALLLFADGLAYALPATPNPAPAPRPA